MHYKHRVLLCFSRNFSFLEFMVYNPHIKLIPMPPACFQHHLGLQLHQCVLPLRVGDGVGRIMSRLDRWKYDQRTLGGCYTGRGRLPDMRDVTQGFRDTRC